MTEIFRKINETLVEIVEEEKIIPEVKISEKTLAELKSDLKQAQDSLVYVQKRHAEEIAPIQATIDNMQRRVNEASKLISREIPPEPASDTIIQ